MQIHDVVCFRRYHRDSLNLIKVFEGLFSLDYLIELITKLIKLVFFYSTVKTSRSIDVKTAIDSSVNSKFDIRRSSAPIPFKPGATERAFP